MWQTVRIFLLGFILPCYVHAQNSTATLCSTQSSYRPPSNSDIMVTCGTDRMDLSILLCPVYYGGYNESLMALNAKFTTPECRGTPDVVTNPPVLKFSFPINEKFLSMCGNSLKISSDVGTGPFSDYSNVQSVNISGIISSLDPSVGTITYRQEILYQFSCRYPLQYLINNTEVSVSGVSLAVKDNNGSFISTLSMSLYSDAAYTQPLLVPKTGLKLKTRIFVEVRASNLTDKFNVLLDRCYASTSPFPANSTYYDLFVGCTKDGQTVVPLNGIAQRAQFSFEAFRFVEHKNLTVSTFYLHCVTRLCENSSCASMLPKCNTTARRRRDVSPDTPIMATVSSGPIMTKVENGDPTEATTQTHSSQAETDLVGVAVTTGVLCMFCIGMAAFIVFLVKKGVIRIV
ncbi:zona pellucida-like domain-containing protein 1 [Denticeps clupeoides]|uniref:ZP domain-containing protein n=1 Tax=Denticeps clupeoides TaxID=299321 RepID=A0AAY4AHC7_9TELE|nr:zona pellucida-like domain-containing protein 1 [Denticeps clupeoides]XP_028825763.1 zona pellucida-like domain-containing protein 1 [Denticeps clupeoides]